MTTKTETKQAGITRTLATFVRNITYVDLPENVRELAKNRILDSLSSAYGGHDLRHSRTAVDIAKIYPGNAKIWGYDLEASLPYAVMANGVMAHSILQEDTFGGHPSTIIPAAVLGVAEVAVGDASHGVLPQHHAGVVFPHDLLADVPGRDRPAVQQLRRRPEQLEHDRARAVTVADQDVIDPRLDEPVDGGVDLLGLKPAGLLVVLPVGVGLGDLHLGGFMATGREPSLHTVSGELPAGRHELRVSFVNDASNPPNEDRNGLVAGAQFAPALPMPNDLLPLTDPPALYVIRHVTGNAPDPTDVPALTEDERDLVHRTHPLLQNTVNMVWDVGLREHSEWYLAIRSKVEGFAKRLGSTS